MPRTRFSRTTRATLAWLAASLFAAGASLAQPAGGSGPPSGERRGPPAEALAACKSLAAGKACSFQHHGKSLAGSCWAPEGRPLACRPKDAPAHGPGDGKPPAR
jgi:hypothetical protein